MRIRFFQPRLWPLLSLFLGLVLLAGSGLWLWGRYRQMAAIGETLASLRPWLLLWRFTLYGVVIGGWPRWIVWLGRYRGWNDTQLARLLALRGRLAAWLLLLELLLAQNLVGHFAHHYLV